MIEPPSIGVRAAMRAAAVHLVIPRTEVPLRFGPAVGEIRAVLAAQGIAAAGPLVAHHLRVTPDLFDFDVAIPVERPVAPAGRVEPRDWPACTVAAMVYRGPYEGLHAAWGEFAAWLTAHGHRGASDLYETYLTDPAHATDPADFLTRLERPLA